MAIWSLTREKVAKLLQEVANKELEIDELLKLSPKQLWATDLDGFITEWRLALEEDKRRASEGTVKKKRGGKMLGKGAKGKKKADADDSDYEAKKKKTAATKAKLDAKKQSTLTFKPAEAEKVDKKPVRAAKKETPVIEELSDDDFDMLEQNTAKVKPTAVPKSKEKISPAELLSSSPAAAEKIGALSKRTEVYNEESDDDDDYAIFQDTVTSKVPPNKNLKAESQSESEKPKTKKVSLKKAPVTSKAQVKINARTQAAAKPKAIPKPFDETDDDEPPAPRATTNRPGRAAATKKSIMDIVDTESDEDGLGDVSAMVKGVGGADTTSIQLFKESPVKPKVSSKKAVAKKAVRPVPKKTPINLYSDDDSDEAVKKSDSDPEEDLVPSKAGVKPATKKAAPTRAAPAKKAAPPRKAPAKPTTKGRGKKPIESEDELDMDQKLDSDSDVDMEEPGARPVSRGRTARGAASKVASYKNPVDSEDDDDDDDDDDASDDFGDDSD